MRTREAITRADELRPNCISAEQKAAWLRTIEGEIAELMRVDVPENLWPEDQELLMPAPHDGFYVEYLQAQIDLADEETERYANDKTVFNQSFEDAKAWWRRHNMPHYRGNWRVM